MAVRKDPKPTAPTTQLQTKPSNSNSPGEGAVYFPPGAIWNQTQDHNRLTQNKTSSGVTKVRPLEPISVL